jgi:hypothetical protein
MKLFKFLLPDREGVWQRFFAYIPHKTVIGKIIWLEYAERMLCLFPGIGKQWFEYRRIAIAAKPEIEFHPGNVFNPPSESASDLFYRLYCEGVESMRKHERIYHAHQLSRRLEYKFFSVDGD